MGKVLTLYDVDAYEKEKLEDKDSKEPVSSQDVVTADEAEKYKKTLS